MTTEKDENPGDEYVKRAQPRAQFARPQGHKAHDFVPIRQPNMLTLMEIAIIRRIVNKGQSLAEVASGLNVTINTVNRHLSDARKRFDVDTRKELLALPEVLEQIKET